MAGAGLAQGPSYGCDETSVTPICAMRQCNPCLNDDQCRLRPGSRDFCDAASGRCVYCEDGDACSVRLQLIAFVKDGSGYPSPYENTFGSIRCGNETAVVRGAQVGGRSSTIVECPSGSEVEVCCAVGPTCFEDPPPQAVIDTGWRITNFDTSYNYLYNDAFFSGLLQRLKHVNPLTLPMDAPTNEVITFDCIYEGP